MDATVEFFISRCEREFTPKEIVLTAADKLHAEGLRRCCVEVAKWAVSKGRDLVIIQWAGDGGRPYHIPSWYASMTPNQKGASTVTNERCPIDEMTNAEIERVAGADFLALHEQMKEWRSEGLIVTLTDMMTNHCLHVNDLQASDRGGGWKGRDWVGLNFLTLWRDSFTPGQFNYFEQLVSTVQRDKHIPQFEYNLRAPNGDLRKYVSDYYFVQAYLDTPVRICVSRPGNWEVIQAVGSV
jgi:hypothetical protein